MSESVKFKFPGTQIDVEWDSRLCIHMGECGQAEGELFEGGREPWCKPDLVDLDNVVDVIERCPSGALTYETKDGSTTETVADENTLLVSYNGPYFLKGDLDIEGAGDDMPGVRYRAALCRCGKSKNKPFCDNQHENISFHDFGAVGEQGTALEITSGKLSVKALPNGPLLIDGNLSILSSSGRSAWSGTNAALCRCGASKNKPFCDGSHKTVNFDSSN
ncbi:hypothetical protein BOW53_12435 [Solemya pervernicosa gill symbiont]|uniref:Iron-binding zinc finger CDGSH type domain-containing protein n=2 Tax=Gammaproteobacteria incertae sedis TaxID=118884 RepID=A0A1T2L2K3_9GAMM|nr:CDGSH iron-sulfur domain-containing protein [Candidatus Reidiella endopervernicosa]OOZ39260.1 hypothetical protein BOW53_12435 [Solemya pervernicosa gill symbiont]QKQ25618.1 CDGSH iron-sulfur domain-containing protein [Candidatus Reidiella endopervernicosa]